MTGAAPGVAIRRALRRDLAGLVELEGLFPSDRISRASLARLVTRESADVWVAEAAGGALAADAIVLYRHGFKAARLYSMVVGPRWRGQGVAAALLEVAEDGAAERGCSQMRLEVREDNRGAIALYRKAGYREVGRTADYYEDRAGALRMSKPLS